jgi:hypothetical protein
VADEEKPHAIGTRNASKRRAKSVTVPIDQTDRNDVLALIRERFATGRPCRREQAIRAVAEALGYRRIGSRIAEILGKDLQTAVRRGILERFDGEYSLNCRGIEEYTREHLVSMLLAAMGSGWQTRVDAISAAARYMGYRRTGRRIADAFKSAINSGLRRGLIEREGTDWIRRAR